MTYREATGILDARREGADVPLRILEKALELTGDLEPEPEPIWLRYTAAARESQ